VVLIGPDLDTATGRTTIRVANTKISTAPVSLLESKLFLTSAAPLEMTNDQTNAITVTGQEFSANTSFFLESTKLEVTSVNPNRATLNIPAGFEPANYGLIAVNPDGAQATLYPGFSIKAGIPARAIDPQLRARSFVDGYVIDYATQQPLSEATISLYNGTGTLEARTDIHGYFLIRGVPAGQNIFKIDHYAYESVYRNANVLGDAQTVTLQVSALEPINQLTTTIGATGGTHYANGSTPDDGFLVVPPGALEKPISLQFTQLHAPETMPELPENNLFTAYAKLEPSGLVFKKPATLFLPIANDLRRKVGQKLTALYFDTHIGKWVNGITTGVVSSVGGKLFAEYEILHFSYAGASIPTPCVYRDPLTPNIVLPCPPDSPDNNTSSEIQACVLYDDGTPANAMTTNWGVTNADGEIRGRIAGLKPGSSKTAKVIGNGDAVPVTATVDESGSIDFPCIRIPRLTPGSPTKPSLDTVDPCQSPAPPINFGAPTPIQTRNQPRASSSSQLVTAQSLKGTTSEIPDYRKYNIDPSKTTLSIGGVDFTGKAVIVPNPNNTENLLVTLVLPEPLKALANLEFKLNTETKEGKKAESSSFVNVAAKVAVPPINFIEISPNFFDDTLPFDPFALEATPTVVYAQGQINIMYKAGDDLSNLDVNLPVVALSENGDIVPINYPSIKLNDQNWTNGSYSLSAPMVNGVAVVPLKLKVLVPGNFSLDIDKAILSDQVSGLSTFSRVQTRNPAVALAVPVVVIGFGAYVVYYYVNEIIKEVIRGTNSGYVDSNMSGIADDLLTSQLAVPRVLQVVPVTAPGVCPITTTGTPALRKPRNRVLPLLATPAQCLPTPDQSAGPSSVPSQERFNENETPPANLEYAAQQGIWDKMLQEADLFCRFGKGTSSKFTKPEIDILKEAGRMWKGGTKNGESRTKVLDFLKSKGLIGEKGKYTGHHQNSKACYPSLARDVKNLTIVESKSSVHRDICHSGKYTNCTFGELFKETADIISEFINVQGLKDDELGVCR
jgi:hypothetical protein